MYGTTFQLFRNVFLCEGDFMSSRSGFMSKLNKSTKITMFSCLGFILLTGIILAFFILFPITPSEKVMASIGRENVLNNGSDGSPQSITPAVVTTVNGENDDVTSVATTTGTTTTRTVNIRITTGSGFLWNGRIPTGVMPGGSSSTTVVDDPAVPTPDPESPLYPQGTTPSDPGVIPPQATTPNPDPNGTVTPPADNPGTSDTPPETPETPVTPPADNPDPPAETPDPPPADSGGSAETPAE